MAVVAKKVWSCYGGIAKAGGHRRSRMLAAAQPAAQGCCGCEALGAPRDLRAGCALKAFGRPAERMGVAKRAPGERRGAAWHAPAQLARLAGRSERAPHLPTG
jgi:hypothetical protein